MAISPSTSVQSLTINKYTNSSYGGEGTCPTGLWLETQYKVTGTSGNTTTLQITLILHHAQINIKAGSDDCYIKIGTQEVSWTGPNLYSTITGQTTTLGTKTITVTHDSNGTFTGKTFLIRYRFNATYGTTTMYYITNYGMAGSNTINLDPRYSACTAPTTISASGAVTPSGSFTVSWSGASGGTNNSINGYDIYYRIASSATNPTTSSYTGMKSVSSTATSGSTSITLRNATRGYIVVCGVVTKGTAGSSFYSSIKTGGSVTVNQIPNAPTLNKSSQTIASTTTNFTVTATAGAANAGSSNTSVWYSINSDKTGIAKYTSALTMNPSAGSSLTYYFWTWDGLEYSSSSTSITITKNTKPTIEFKAGTSVSTFTALDFVASGNFLGWADLITPSITTNKGGTVTRVVELNRYATYTSSTDSRANTFSANTTYSLANETLSSSATNKSMSSVAPYDAIKNKYGATLSNSYTYYAWRIKYVLTDSYESSDAVYFPASNKWYAIPTMPAITVTSATPMYKTATFSLINESSANLSVIVTATINSTSVALTSSTSTSGTTRTVTANLTNAPASEASVVFTISYLKGGVTKSRSVTVGARKTPGSLGNLSISRDTVKPFSESDDIVFSATWPFIGSDIDSYVADYNISSINIAFSNSGGSATRSGTVTKDGSFLKVTIGANSIYDWTSPWGITSYAGVYSFTAKISITSDYGETFTSGTQTFKLNFNEPISGLKITNFYRVYSTSSLTSMYSPPATPGGTATMDSIGFAQNNVGCIALSYSGYTRDTCTVEVYFDGSVIKTYTISNSGQTGHGSYIIDHAPTVSSEKFTIPEITKVKTPVKIVVTNNYGSSTFEIDGGMNTVRQTTPIMALTSLEIDNNEFSGRLTISDLGVSSNGQTNPYAVSDGSSLYSGAFSVTGTGSSYTFSGVARTGTDFDSKSLTLRFTSKVTIYSNSSTSTTTSSKNYYLNYITVYKASPTVAYRKNAIGINTSSPKSGAALDVHNSSTTSNVYFQGLNALWTFNIESGTVQFNSNTPLDLKNLLTTAGAITDNTVIATNDRIVFSDDSDSGKLKRSTIVFDTTVTNKYLSQAGTWADSLSTTTLTATGEISGASITTTGNGSIGNNLNVDGSILFEEREQTGHKYIYFANAASSTNHHDMAIYGGGPSSVNAFGIWDISQGSPYYWPFLYRDANKEIMLDVSSSDYSKGYLADFPIEVKKDTTTGLYYKKWHSGLGEVFGRIKILGSEVTESTESGGVYYSNTIYVDLPLTFKYVSGSQNDDICMVLSGGSYLTWAANTGLTNSGSRIAFRLLRTIPLSSSIDYGMYLHVQGPLAGSFTGSTIYTDRTFSG